MLGVLIASATVNTAHADVQTVMVECGNPTRQGSGFVVKQVWGPSAAPPGEPSLVLLTALHVLHNCRSISISSPAGCGDRSPPVAAWSVPPETRIWTWPKLDLAGIVLPVGPSARPRIRAAELVLTPDNLSGLPRTTLPLAIGGFTSRSECSQGVGFVKYPVDVQTHAQHLADEEGTTAARMRGSLSGLASMLLYFGDSTHGTSGGPVTLGGSDRVIAIQEGGYSTNAVSWAILPTASLMDGGQVVVFQGAQTRWGQFAVPGMPTGREPDGAYDDDGANDALQTDLRRSMFSLALAAESRSSDIVAPTLASGEFSASVAFAVGEQDWLRRTQLMFRARVSGTYELAAQRWVGFDGRELDSSLETGWGAALSGGLGFEFARHRRLRWALYATAGGRYDSVSDAIAPRAGLVFRVGLAAAGEARMTALELGVGGEYALAGIHRYVGIGAETEPPPWEGRWVFSAGLSQDL